MCEPGLKAALAFSSLALNFFLGPWILVAICYIHIDFQYVALGWRELISFQSHSELESLQLHFQDFCATLVLLPGRTISA